MHKPEITVYDLVEAISKNEHLSLYESSVDKDKMEALKERVREIQKEQADE